MPNLSSPLDTTLRQLKEMLDAGILTPAEFEVLKQRLVLRQPANMPPAPADAALGSLQSPPPLLFEPHPEPFEPLPIAVMPEELPLAADSYEFRAAASPDETAPEPEPDETWETTDADADAAPPTPNSPLALVLSIGGVLVFLALVAYLALNPAPSERLSSTSQTAADSVAAIIETGPQAAPLPPTTAVPETIRLRPTNPAPAVQPRPAPSDSMDLLVPTADSLGRY